MKLTIYSDGSIALGIQPIPTGYRVLQQYDRTVVLACSDSRKVDLGTQVFMPRTRYTLATDDGQAEFAVDFLKMYNA